MKPAKAVPDMWSGNAPQLAIAEDADKDFSQMLSDAKATAEAPLNTVVAQQVDPMAFYWSERMDISLAQSVHACMYDFDEVSGAVKGKLSGEDAALRDKITSDACRARWCELDVDDEGMMNGAPVESAKTKIHVGENGKQMSFAELQRSVNSQASATLKAPQLPEVESSGEEEEEEVGVFSVDALRKQMMTNFETLD